MLYMSIKKECISYQLINKTLTTCVCNVAIDRHFKRKKKDYRITKQYLMIDRHLKKKQYRITKQYLMYNG